MGLEVGTARVKHLADDLGLARVLFVNMLDRERADFYRTLAQIQEQFSSRCVAVHLPIGAEHEICRDRRRPSHVRVHEPERRQGSRADRHPGGDARARPGVPREAARRGRPDRRGADGAVPRRRGARPACGRLRAEGRDHARRGVPRRVRRRHQEPRHPCAARPDRRGRPVARQEGRADRDRGRRDGGLRLQDARRSVRRPDQPLPRAPRGRHRRLDARRRARPREGADGDAAAAPGQGQRGREGVRRGRHRRRREAQGRAHRRPADRPRDRRRAARDRVPGPGDELRDHAADRRGRRRRSPPRSAGSQRRTRRSGSVAISRPGRRSSRG